MKRKNQIGNQPSRLCKIEVGGRLLLLLAMIFTLNVVGVAAALLTPLMTVGVTSGLGFKLAMKDLFSTKGLDAEQRELVRGLNEQIQELEIDDALLVKAGFVKGEDYKKEINKSITDALKGLLNEDGKFAFEMDRLKSLLGKDAEDPKGIYNVVKDLAENVKAMQEVSTKTASANFESLLLKQMPEIEKVYNKKQGAFEFNLKVATIMTTDSAGAIEGNEALPPDFLESFSVGAFVPKRFPREYVFDMASRTTVADIKETKIWLEEGEVEGGFAVVAEGGLKPLVSGALIRNFSQVQKIAAKQRYTEEFAKFRKEAFSIIKRMINQKLLRDYAALLTTALLADAAPYVSSALTGTVPVDKVTDYHAIAAVAAQIESIDFYPDMLIMNPGDKWRIGMSQDANGQFYLQIPTTDPSGQTRIMGFVLRTSNRVPVGTFLLGEAGLWEIEDEAITVRTGYGVSVTGGTSNGGGNVTDVQSDLDHNRFTIIVETYFHTFIASNNEGSFVVAEFEDVKDDVTEV
jgi:hypothetical protein